ncbi:MAG: PQQ-binding-like beta-propeller repeat protein [Ilumatobacteraceae bacterium]|nr:PQQ-binding-like beta-propeller repeat protein [Ilumatobacteraceae bacterium]
MGTRRAVLASILALAACGGDEVADLGCQDGATGPGGVVGFDVDSGEPRWSVPVGWPNGAAVFDDFAVVSTAEHVVRGIAIDSGEVVWCVEFEPGDTEFSGGIAAAGPVVGALAGDSVVGLDPATGVERWRRQLQAPEATLRGGDVLWVLDGSVGGTPIMVLEPTTGEDASDVDDGASEPVSFGIGTPPRQVGGLELSTAAGGSDRQTIEVSVSRDDSVVWDDTVPGFVAALVAGPAEPIVLVLDQTGGTGDLAGSADTILTAYAAIGGDRQWQHALPGTPHLIAQLSDEVIAVPVGIDVHAIDITTGAETWVAELPNPGRGGSYEQAGTFWFIDTGSSGTAVAVGRAEQPYRD